MEKIKSIDKKFLRKRPLSYSSLKEWMKSPAHYIHYLNEPRVQTDAMKLGTVLDVLLLTPENFYEEVAIMPDDMNRRGAANQAAYDAFIAANSKKTVVKQAVVDQAREMINSIMSNTDALELLNATTVVQETHKFRDKETGLPLIGKLDSRCDWDIVWDLKKTTDADPYDDPFARDAMKFKYPLQAAMYLKAAAAKGKFPSFYFLVVEDKAPYGVAVRKADSKFIDLGKYWLDKALQEVKYCLEYEAKEGERPVWEQTYEFRSAGNPFVLDIPYYAQKFLA